MSEFINYIENNCFLLWFLTCAAIYSVIVVSVIIGLLIEPVITIIVVFMIWLISMLYQYRKFKND